MKETLAAFLARGGAVEVVHYKNFADVEIPKPTGMRGIVKNGWKTAAAKGGIRSGAVRRAKAQARELLNAVTQAR